MHLIYNTSTNLVFTEVIFNRQSDAVIAIIGSCWVWESIFFSFNFVVKNVQISLFFSLFFQIYIFLKLICLIYYFWCSKYDIFFFLLWIFFFKLGWKIIFYEKGCGLAIWNSQNTSHRSKIYRSESEICRSRSKICRSRAKLIKECYNITQWPAIETWKLIFMHKL